MGRTSRWNNQVMQPLRIPVIFASCLRQLAKAMDSMQDDEELIFTCKMKNVKALQSDLLEAAEIVLKVTSSAAREELHPDLTSSDDSAINPEPEEEDQAEATPELDLSTLVRQDPPKPTSFDFDFDPDAVIDQVTQSFWLHETDPPEQKSLEQPDWNVEQWHEAIGDVDPTANDVPTVAQVAQPEIPALLDLTELSTLFTVSPTVETEPKVTNETEAFDPDAVIESVNASLEAAQLNHNDADSSPFVETKATEAFDPDAVIEGIQAAAIEPTVEPIQATSEPIRITDSTLEVLPPIVVPPLQPKSLTAFANQLFETWQQLAAQKLKQQKRPQAQLWGVAVDLNDLYRTQFTEMSGNHFLKRLQEVVLASIPGKTIQLIAIPGIVNFTIAGVDANAISYETNQRNAQTQAVQMSLTQTKIAPTQSTAAPKPVSDQSDTTVGGTTTRAVLLAEPTLSDDMARLLKERKQRLAALSTEQEPKRKHWFKQLLGKRQ